jgi:hypothetical protein
MKNERPTAKEICTTIRHLAYIFVQGLKIYGIWWFIDTNPGVKFIADKLGIVYIVKSAGLIVGHTCVDIWHGITGFFA